MKSINVDINGKNHELNYELNGNSVSISFENTEFSNIFLPTHNINFDNSVQMNTTTGEQFDVLRLIFDAIVEVEAIDLPDEMC